MSYPSWVLANVVAGLQNLVATLEAIASSYALDPAAVALFKVAVATGPAPSATVAAPTADVPGLSNAFVALYNALPVLVTDTTGVDPSVAPGLAALALGLGAAMAPADAVAAFAAAADAIADAPPAPTTSANRLADAANAQIVARLSRAVLLGAYAQAIVATSYPARPDAITTRADCVERFERELGLCRGALDAQLARGLTAARDACVAYLSEAIINLAPIMTVSANIYLPSLWWAWRLYQDPTRAADLIARNDVAHASYMPTRFEALAP
jgi:prophage DNA circulation protein